MINWATKALAVTFLGTFHTPSVIGAPFECDQSILLDEAIASLVHKNDPDLNSTITVEDHSTKAIFLGPNFDPEENIEICFQGSTTISQWNVAIVESAQNLEPQNVGNKWARVCGSIQNGCVTFQRDLFDGPPGTSYRAFLTTHQLEKEADPVSFRVGIEEAPSETPSSEPSLSTVPTNRPSQNHSSKPSTSPNVTPSMVPSSTTMPTKMPSMIPSFGPSLSTVPSKVPSVNPSFGPTLSNEPSESPSTIPSPEPSMTPSATLSAVPSSSPSTLPSPEPSTLPTVAPSTNPSLSCDSDTEIERIQEGSKTVSRVSNRVNHLSSESSILPTSSISPYDDYGCFYHDEGQNVYISEPLTGHDKPIDARAEECYDVCDTQHFAISDTTCFCYVKAPTTRLTIGSCATVPADTCLDKNRIIDAYLKKASSIDCNQENTAAVRDQFVDEDNAPRGYDITTNSVRPSSPFLLSKDECGTNIYEIQTKVTEGTNTLSTVSEDVSDFASERRRRLANRITTSASGSAWFKFVKVAVRVMASLDTEVNDIMKYSGSTTIGSKIFTSFGAKTIAEFKIIDFDNRFNFVTFSEQFGSALRDYRDSGFEIEKAKEIFDEYGMFVVERGMFGGFRQLRSVATSKDVENFSSSESDFRLCFEAAMSAEAKVLFGLTKKEGSVGIARCTEDVQQEMQRQQQKFSQEVTTEIAQGGKIVVDQKGVKSFVVSPRDSILLTDPDKYPENDDGIKLRILTDFLNPTKISPLEVRTHFITEKEFEDIRNHLDAHIVEVLQGKLDSLEQCPPPDSPECAVPYLEEKSENDESYECACYNPIQPTLSPSPQPSPSPTLGPVCNDGVFQPDENQFYTIQTKNANGSYWTNESKIVISKPGSKNEATSHWKFESFGNNWFLRNGLAGNYISGIGDGDRLKVEDSGKEELKVTCQNDGTVKFSESSGTTSRFGATVETFSKSTNCRYPTFLDSCDEEFGSTYVETDYRECGSLDLKRIRVCSQYSITFPKRVTLNKESGCAFPNFLAKCDELFGSGWKETKKESCGAFGARRRRKCQFKTTDNSSTFFIKAVY